MVLHGCLLQTQPITPGLSPELARATGARHAITLAGLHPADDEDLNRDSACFHVERAIKPSHMSCYLPLFPCSSSDLSPFSSFLLCRVKAQRQISNKSLCASFLQPVDVFFSQVVGKSNSSRP